MADDFVSVLDVCLRTSLLHTGMINIMMYSEYLLELVGTRVRTVLFMLGVSFFFG